MRATVTEAGLLIIRSLNGEPAQHYTRFLKKFDIPVVFVAATLWPQIDPTEGQRWRADVDGAEVRHSPG